MNLVVFADSSSLIIQSISSCSIFIDLLMSIFGYDFFKNFPIALDQSETIAENIMLDVGDR